MDSETGNQSRHGPEVCIAVVAFAPCVPPPYVNREMTRSNG